MSGWSVRGRHLPALDGLRALAVLAVVAYHLGEPWARGGYLGVDLFFVLSGFLITSLLLEEHAERGTIALSSFWARRARRLLPALFAMVAAVELVVILEGRYGNSTGVASFDLSGLQNLAYATMGYAANWFLIASQHSYFAQFAAPSPLQHTWSLAIEEQFYLVWPFLTLLLVRGRLASRRRRGLAVTVVLVAASTALMAALYHPGGDPSRVYYGTDTRLADLAVGAALAWATAGRPATPPWAERLLGALAPAALAGLLVMMVLAGTSGGVPSGFMFDGGFLVASLLCAIVIADVRRPGSLLAKGLSLRPVVAIGLVSYGLYLWHWPVIVLTAAVTSLHAYALLIVRLGLMAALVTASYLLIEQPVRRRVFPVRVRWALYPTAVAGAVLVTAVATPSFVIRNPVRDQLVAYAPASVVPGAGGLAGERPIALPFVPTPSHHLRVVLLGDSQMVVDGPGIAAALQATGVVTVVNDGFDGWGTEPRLTIPWRSWVRHVVTSSRAQLVFMTTGWDGPDAEHPAAYEATLAALVSVARSAGAAGVVFVQYPVTRPSEAATPGALAAAARAVSSWNHDVAAMPARLPGQAMYLPVARAVELDGAYSAWVPPPRDESAPRVTWDRVRRVDGVHLCPPGIELLSTALAADAVAIWHLPEPAPGWWVDGWQRADVITSGEQYCPDDHPS